MVNNKTYCKINDINKDSVIVEMYLPNGEILRKLNKDVINKIKELNLLEKGKEFYFVLDKVEKEIKIKIEPYIQQYNKDVEDMYDELLK